MRCSRQASHLQVQREQEDDRSTDSHGSLVQTLVVGFALADPARGRCICLRLLRTRSHRQLFVAETPVRNFVVNDPGYCNEKELIRRIPV